MLPSLHLQNFRAFRDFRMEGLARVNLLVGGNNEGKSSILEAVELVATGFSSSTLSRILKRRGEVRIEDGEPRYDLRYLFTGGEISKLKLNFLELWKEYQYEQDPVGPALFFNGNDSYGLLFPGPDGGATDAELRLLGPGGGSCLYVGPGATTLSELAAQWDQISSNPEEDRVIDVLRIIDPDIERIVFTGGNGSRAAFLRKKGWKERLPIGTMGEGLRRLIAIALPLALSRDSTLTVDEIDNGLHWAVLVDLWRMLLRTSSDLNIQIFATTHSLDCLRALAWLYEQDPALCSTVAVHRVSPTRSCSVRYDAAEVAIAIEHMMEIRGFPSGKIP